MANALYKALPTTIFTVMSGLAREHGAINLGQGFPDEPGPRAIRERAALETLDGDNQYPPTSGIPELREAVADHYARTQGLEFDWRSEVTVTSGATEALAACFLGLIEPGDEVVLFQPIYDSYLPMVRRAGGTARLVRLAPPHWRFDRATLEAAFSDRTRLVVLNNPLNPTGTVASGEELALLAEFCVRHDAVARLRRGLGARRVRPARHTSPMDAAGMRERTVKIGSAGKMFALTGWKVGFLCAAPALTQVLAKAHQFLSFTTPPNLQAAVAWGLANSDAWFADMPAALAASRDRLIGALSARRLRGALEPGHLLPQRRPGRLGRSARRPGVLPLCCTGSGRRGDPCLRLLRDRSGDLDHPPLLRQARRDAGRGRAKAGQGAGPRDHGGAGR